MSIQDRLVGVAIALNLWSLITILVPTLAGSIPGIYPYLFQVNAADFSLAPKFVDNLVGSCSPRPAGIHERHLFEEMDGMFLGARSTNITAEDLGLYNLYDIGLWGYCYTSHTGSRACTRPGFNWAQHALDRWTKSFGNQIGAPGVILPEYITETFSLFASVTLYTQIAFIVALALLCAQVYLGVARTVSWVTFPLACIATIAVCAATALSTCLDIVVIMCVEGVVAQWDGATINFNDTSRKAVWIGAACAIFSNLFWSLGVCVYYGTSVFRSRKLGGHGKGDNSTRTDARSQKAGP